MSGSAQQDSTLAGKSTHMAARDDERWAELMQKDYHHPYTPYDVQKDFMSMVYKCLEGGKVGVFESPTGTGKSLSLICGSLTWLRDFKRRQFEQVLNEDGEENIDEPDWMIVSAREQKRKLLLQDRADREAKLARIRKKEEKARQRYENGEPPSKRQRTNEYSKLESDDEAEFLLDDYDSGDESSNRARQAPVNDTFSAETQALLAKLGELPVAHTEINNDDTVEDELKIFYCSRTHSQITQFVNELRRVKLPPSVPPDPDTYPVAKDKKDKPLIEELKHLTLGSRKNLCINLKVAKSGASTTSINEQCLELQQTTTPKDERCPYLPNKDNEVLVNDFRDHALARIRDIEDFGKLGKKIGICPYYATRAAVKPAEIVTLPYPLLLQKSAREALSISLKGHIIIIDEAHNLLDAISSIHSSSITLFSLQLGRNQLGGYLVKFRNRLKGKNRVYVTQLVRVIDSIVEFLVGRLAGKEVEGEVQAADLMKGKGVDQINLFKLMRYLHESKIARKVERYAVFAEEQQQTTSTASSKQVKDSIKTKENVKAGTPVLTQLQSFLLTLTSPAAEGRFFFSKVGEEDVSLKYLLLDPTHHFREIVEEARAVILAGGTMSPIADYTTHLLPHVPPSRLLTLSCSHVIPPSNLLAMPISYGPTGIPFDFTFGSRSDERMILELGRGLLQLCQTVPDGVVVFFGSYAYLESVCSVWKKHSSAGDGSKNIWEAIQQRKKIFVEPSSNPATSSTSSTSSTIASKRSTTSSSSTTKPNPVSTIKPPTTDSILQAYTAHILSSPPATISKPTSSSLSTSSNGALLLAVIGGSLSEGINFSDRLGRCVVVVGLPFPNASGGEWKARLEHVGSKAVETTVAVKQEGSPKLTAKDEREIAEKAKREFYTNTCMRSVNQSVGRAIRHQNDWASILLIDGRWEKRKELREKLPGWIRRSLVGVEDARRGGGGGGDGHGPAQWMKTRGRLEEFFEGKKGW